MGLSLRNIGKKITDVFDANSAEDQRKRLAVGQPRYYADQQRLGPQPAYRATPQRQAQPSAIQNFATMARQTVDPMRDSIAVNQIRLGAANLTNNDVAATNARAGIGRAYGTLKTNLQDPNYVAGIASPGGVGRLKPKVTPKTTGVAPKPVVKPVGSQLEEAVLGPQRTPQYKERPLGKLSEKLSINRQARKITQPIEAGADKLVRKSLESGNIVTRTPGRAIVGVSKQAGKSRVEMQRLAKYEGEKQLGDIYGKAVAKSGSQAIDRGVRPQAVASALDPELHVAKGGKPMKLTSDEAAEVQRLRQIIDTTHEGNYQLGLLDEAKYTANKGKYFPRDMSEFFENDPMRQIARNNKMELNVFKPRKDLSDIPKEVIDAASSDPYFLTALRVQQFQRNKAFKQYSDWLADNGTISPGPRKGFVQIPDQPAYGALRGQHVLKEQAEDLQGFIYETGVAQDIVSLLNRYDRLPPRKARKAILTIFNPGVRLGNRTFNNLVASLNGINPLTFNKNWARGRKMMLSNSPEYLEAARHGVFGSSIIQKELYRTTDLKTKPGLGSKVIGKVGDSYQAVDDRAKMSAYLTFRERGLSAPEAAERTRRMMQNYDMVGQMFDLGSKTPVMGNAFVRFSSELMRIAHNTAADNPIRLAGAAVAVATMVEAASRMSGESPEDRKTREERLGAPRVPFTDQSLEIQSPWGAINIGRLLGLTTYNDLVGGATEDVKRLTPFQSPVRKDETGFHANVPGLTADPLIGPIVGQLMNRDFRGKPITDPDMEKFPSQPLSGKEQIANRLDNLKQSYVPFANEADSLRSAAKGEPNYYGKERTLPQAILRTVGVKVEQFGKKQAEETRGRNQYFEGEFKRAGKFLRDNPTLKPAYEAFKGREKDRKTGKKLIDIVTPERWKLVTADTSGKLYNFLKSESLKAEKDEGQPADPIYKLENPERVKDVLEIRSRPPGDQQEREEILRATSNWYSQFEKAERDFYDAQGKFYEGKGLPDSNGPRMKAWLAVKHPEQSPLVKRYYEVKTNQGDEAGKQFFKANADQLSADFDSYRAARLQEINAKRKIMGLSPIEGDTYNNVTFGYEDDERKVYNQLKYGKGYGGYGSGGSSRKAKSVGSAYKYAVSLNAGGAPPKPTVTTKAPPKPKARRKIAAPKVSLKKSKV